MGTSRWVWKIVYEHLADKIVRCQSEDVWRKVEHPEDLVAIIRVGLDW